MKICFINPSVGTIAGGSETIVHQFAKHLCEKHDVTILTGRSRHKPMQKELLDTPYEVLTVPFWPRFTPPNNLACKLIRRLTPYKAESFSLYYNILIRPKIKQRIKNMDVISTHYWLDSRLFSNLAFKLGVPSVFHILGGPYSQEFFEVDKSTLYIATNLYTKNLINDAHGRFIEDIVTPGVPSWVFSRSRDETQKKLNDLLFVGRLQPSKGLYELMDIFTKLRESNPNLKLTIVGDGDIMEDLREIGIKRNLQGEITFTGQLPYKKVFEWFNNSRVFIFPSKNETFGIVPLEAMACGLPVVCSDIPALRESTGRNAILIPPEDLDSWIEAVTKILSDEELRKELSKKGIEWAKRFTWEKKAEEYAKGLLKARERFIKGGERS